MFDLVVNIYIHTLYKAFNSELDSVNTLNTNPIFIHGGCTKSRSILDIYKMSYFAQATVHKSTLLMFVQKCNKNPQI